MNYTEFRQTAGELGYDLEETTVMDAYATYEVTHCTVEAAVELALEDEENNLDY